MTITKVWSPTNLAQKPGKPQKTKAAGVNPAAFPVFFQRHFARISADSL
jgi:hypothetical protein